MQLRSGPDTSQAAAPASGRHDAWAVLGLFVVSVVGSMVGDVALCWLARMLRAWWVGPA